ncbi:MAG: NADH-quinone oxidoreductase subunit J [Candidatus Ratteibacteria bacterium]
MDIFFYLGLTIFSILAVILRDLLKSAISLAVASIFLSMIFFRLGAPIAGVFELSIVAGLIMVLFISTIVLTSNVCEEPSSQTAKTILPLVMAVFIVIDAFIVRAIMGKLVAIPASRETLPFNEILWNIRTFDLVGQIALILAGVAAVLAFFRTRGADDA